MAREKSQIKVKEQLVLSLAATVFLIWKSFIMMAL